MKALERLIENMDWMNLQGVAKKTGIVYDRLRRATMYGKRKEILTPDESDRLEGFLILRGKSLLNGSDSPSQPE